MQGSCRLGRNYELLVRVVVLHGEDQQHEHEAKGVDHRVHLLVFVDMCIVGTCGVITFAFGLQLIKKKNNGEIINNS